MNLIDFFFTKFVHNLNQLTQQQQIPKHNLLVKKTLKHFDRRVHSWEKCLLINLWFGFVLLKTIEAIDVGNCVFIFINYY